MCSVLIEIKLYCCLTNSFILIFVSQILARRLTHVEAMANVKWKTGSPDAIVTKTRIAESGKSVKTTNVYLRAQAHVETATCVSPKSTGPFVPALPRSMAIDTKTAINSVSRCSFVII